MNSSIIDVLFRMKRGLAGYVSYLAACDMNQSFSEYILYEPALRILTAQGFVVHCEYPCPGFTRVGSGDNKKLDFFVERGEIRFAIEVKWARKRNMNLSGDIEKLAKLKASIPAARAFLFIFGRKSVLGELRLDQDSLIERGSPIYAEFGVTRYGCRCYEFTGK